MHQQEEKLNKDRKISYKILSTDRILRKDIKLENKTSNSFSDSSSSDSDSSDNELYEKKKTI